MRHGDDRHPGELPGGGGGDGREHGLSQRCVREGAAGLGFQKPQERFHGIREVLCEKRLEFRRRAVHRGREEVVLRVAVVPAADLAAADLAVGRRQGVAGNLLKRVGGGD